MQRIARGNPGVISVGSTDSNDVKQDGSGWGSCIGLFAPGVNIQSDWIGGPEATATISGTSMAAPHVAGAAAAYLADNSANTSPDTVASALLGRATVGAVVNPGTNTPNRLLYSPPPTTGSVDVVNAGALSAWRSAMSNAVGQSVKLGVAGDSVFEGQGVSPGPSALSNRVIEKLQSKIRAKSSIPYCYTDPTVYRKSSTLIPGWYQSSPQMESAEVPKSGPVNDAWLRDSTVGPGGRAAHLELKGDSASNVQARGTSATFSGVFTKVDIDYYASAWGRRIEVVVDGVVVLNTPTYLQLGAYEYKPMRFTWSQPSGAAAQHTVVVTAIRDTRFFGGSVVLVGSRPMMRIRLAA
ncbi:S8 family serine peptidase [Calidifontibacter sp. DB0510]|uniref:S8 family serine peptidase n=1 Tax=Metallococcus carri TaxID=1656884 RepID=A0A967B5S6_9MICO|nr:S8 family serine peptidase [Metallococcus carri]NHN55151.1 S8 family serine peptidase [Metallococcus carri]NOP36228.1 S8 family serine peptidase [Calidifontibacter sp. DB2511S]